MRDEWVTYSEKSPPRADRYLVADSIVDAPYIAYFTKRNGFTDDTYGPLDQYVTHWQELPPMPGKY
jgi:hypothetical protein